MRLLFLIAVAFAGYLIYKLYFQKLMAQGQAGKIKIALIVLGLAFLVAAATGRAPAIFAVLGAAMTQAMRLAPLLIKFAPGMAGFFGGKTNPSGASSESRIRTQSLVMSLDQVSGRMHGEIISGEFAGRQLADLTTDELKAFYQYCEQHDTEAVRILQAYIARERQDWEDAPSDEAQDASKLPSGELSVRDAFDILGLEPDSSKEQVIQAHRSLMMQFHPDKGGSNYFASKVNEAKTVLLDSMDGQA